MDHSAWSIPTWLQDLLHQLLVLLQISNWCDLMFQVKLSWDLRCIIKYNLYMLIIGYVFSMYVVSDMNEILEVMITGPPYHDMRMSVVSPSLQRITQKPRCPFQNYNPPRTIIVLHVSGILPIWRSFKSYRKKGKEKNKESLSETYIAETPRQFECLIAVSPKRIAPTSWDGCETTRKVEVNLKPPSFSCTRLATWPLKNWPNGEGRN